MKEKLFLIAVLFLFSANLSAQTEEKSKSGSVQVTFAYPIGSNGTNSMEYSNNFSLNILFGLNGGVNGAEIGSILNYNKGEVKGLQLSGVSNISKGSTNGLVISGVLNYSEGNSKGVQISTANFSANEFNGFQLGVFNHAKKLNGVQLGVVNILGDGKKGIPIGLVSIVKNGHFEFELTGGEVIYSTLSYKMGINNFYTVYNAGYSSYKSKPVYSFGIGFGGNVPLSKKHNININLTANGIAYDNKLPEKLNLLNKLDINYKYNINKNLSLVGGPSFNLYITKEKVDGEYGTLHIPYTISTNNITDGKTSLWIGLNAGLSYKL